MEDSDLQSYENQLASLVSECNKDEIADCALLLAMYVAHYRSKDGELSISNFKELLTTDIIDEDTTRTLLQGIKEMISTLELVTGHIITDEIVQEGSEPIH